MFVFRPRLIDAPRNSKRDPSLPPRWWRNGCLGTVVEKEGRAVFIPGAHPGLVGFGEHDLGIAETATTT
jgi:hypothetical protein